MPADQRAIWDDLAPRAVANGTLTAETVAGFRHLCKCVVIEGQLLTEILKRGFEVEKVTLKMDESGGGLQVVETKANPLITKWTALLVRVEAGMARYRLTGDGKMRTGSVVPKELTPLERLRVQAKIMQKGKV